MSRRVRYFQLFGLSFREFLVVEGLLPTSQKPFSLEDILKNHVSIAQKLNKEITLLPAFQKYLQYGYYTYFQEDIKDYSERVLQTFNTVMEGDLPNLESIDFYLINRIKKLFYILSEMVPFTPNISQLSQMVDVKRVSLMNYLNHLEKSHSVLLLKQKATSMQQMVKPEKFICKTQITVMPFQQKIRKQETYVNPFPLINCNKITQLHTPNTQIFALMENIILKLAVKTKPQNKLKT